MTNKLKTISIAICCLIAFWCSETQGMDDDQEIDPVRYQVAIQQEEEGSHHLANHNYDLVFNNVSVPPSTYCQQYRTL